MSKALVNRILNAREEVTTADGRWHGWTETEKRLAEYAAELQGENARLAAELAAAREESQQARNWLIGIYSDTHSIGGKLMCEFSDSEYMRLGDFLGDNQ